MLSTNQSKTYNADPLAMNERKTILVLLSAALLALSRLNSVAQVESLAPSPVRQIDHIMIRTDVPERLYAFLTETLRLPIAWPLAVRGSVASGAAGFGNVNVEVIKFSNQRPHTQLVGFGFEPTPLAQCLVELRRRELHMASLAPLSLRNETDQTRHCLPM